MRTGFNISFTESINKLEPKEVKATMKTFEKFGKSQDLAGFNLEKLKNNNLYSIRVNRDIRIITGKQDDIYIFCYVDHHDKAYAWANGRKFDFHPKTKVAQLIRLDEKQEEVRRQKVSKLMEQEELQQPYLQGLAQDQILSVGVPREYVAQILTATESEFDKFIDNGFDSALERLMHYKQSGKLEPPEPVSEGADPFQHPDSRREFYIIEDEADLNRILEMPWEEWLLFLHPSQRKYVEGDYDGPVCISGAAGTGKTIVALHRAAYLAEKHPDKQILLTTLSENLVEDIKRRVKLLSDAGNIKVRSLNYFALELYKNIFGAPNVIKQAGSDKINSIEGMQTSNKISYMIKKIAPKHLPVKHLCFEWYEVADAWQTKSFEEYRQAPRLGKRIQFTQQQYQEFWSVFEQLRAQLKEENLITPAEMFSKLASHFNENPSLFDFIIVDEAQDISIPQTRLLALLGGSKQNGLFFCSDLGQRVYQQSFSWKACGIDIQDRFYTLRKNYRNSQQIQKQNEQLLPSNFTDVDGNIERRQSSLSTFNSAQPIVRAFEDRKQEIAFIIKWLKNLIEKEVRPEEIAIFTRYVVVAVCDMDMFPSQYRLERYSTELGIDEIYDTERQLLYVAASRAREHILITGVRPISPFIQDLAT